VTVLGRYLHLKNNIVIILSLLLNINYIYIYIYIYLLLKLFSFVHLAYGLFLVSSVKQTSHCYNDLTELRSSYKICFHYNYFFPHLRLIASRTLIGRMVKLAKAEARAHQAVN